MKKFLLIIGLVLGAAAVYLWKKSDSVAPVEAAFNRKTAAPSIARLKGEAIPKEELQTATIAADKVPAECKTLWETAVSSSNARLSEDVKRGVFRLIPSCAGLESNEIAKSAFTACAYDEDHGVLLNETECLKALLYARAIWTDRLTPDQKDYKNMSLTLLANKIFARFPDIFQDPKAREEMREMVGAMIEREPESFEAHKALVAVEMADALGAEGAPGNFDGMLTAIDAGMKLDPRDPQLNEAYLFAEQMGGHSDAVNSYLERNPDSGLAYYYRAWQSWNGGDREGAIADLQNAIRLSPADQRMAKTLSDVRSGQNPQPFNISLGFTFSSD